MSKKAWMIVSLIGAVCMAAMAIASVAMKGCTTMLECTSGYVPMKCHWTFIVTAYLGGIGCIMGIVGALQKERDARRIAAVAAILIAAVAILVTTSLGIGTCAHEDSGCHAVAYVVWACGGANIVVSIIQLLKADPKSPQKPKMQL